MRKSVFLLALFAPQLMLAAGISNVVSVEDDSTYVHELEQVEVTAMRMSSSEPVASTKITSEAIKRQSDASDVPYLLQSIPSVIATSDAGNGVGYTDIRMRGYDGSRINVTIGDITMNEPESQKVYWVDTPDLAQSSGSVQVGRGAAASSIGCGSFGGSINFQPQQFNKTFCGETDILYGSYNTNRERVRIASGLLGGKWSVEGVLSHTGSDGYMERASSELLSYSLQTGYLGERTMVKLLLFGGSEHTYNAWDGISAEQMKKNRRYNPCGEIVDKNGEVTGYYDNQKDNFLQLNNHLSLRHQFNGQWSLNSTLHYTYGNGYYDQYKNNKKLAEYMLPELHDAGGEVIKRSNLTREKRQFSHYGGFIAYALYKNDKVTTNFGIAYNHYFSGHVGYVTSVNDAVDFMSNSKYYDNDYNKDDCSAFAKAVWEPVKGLDIMAEFQFRYNEFSIKGVGDVYDYTNGGMVQMDVRERFHFANPKLGIGYTFAKVHNVYASAAMANREPTRKDYINAIGLDQPKPERLVDVEFGYKVKSKWVHGSVNFYYMLYKDQLVLTGAQNPDTYEALYTNVDNSYRRGIELEAVVTPLKWLWFGGNLSLSQNRVTDFTETIPNNDTWGYDENYIGTSTLSYSPSITAAIRAGVDIKGFKASWNTRYVGSQYITNASNDNLKLPSYWVSDLSLGYGFKIKGGCRINLSVAINNILNAEYCSNAFAYSYIEDGARVDEISYFPQAKINAYGKVSVEF